MPSRPEQRSCADAGVPAIRATSPTAAHRAAAPRALRPLSRRCATLFVMEYKPLLESWSAQLTPRLACTNCAPHMTPLGAHRCGSKARITAIPWPYKRRARERHDRVLTSLQRRNAGCCRDLPKCAVAERLTCDNSGSNSPRQPQKRGARSPNAKLTAVLTFLLALVPHAVAEPAHGIATLRRTEAAAGLHAFLLRQSGGAEGQAGSCSARSAPTTASIPLIVKGDRGQRHPRLHVSRA